MLSTLPSQCYPPFCYGNQPLGQINPSRGILDILCELETLECFRNKVWPLQQIPSLMVKTVDQIKFASNELMRRLRVPPLRFLLHEGVIFTRTSSHQLIHLRTNYNSNHLQNTLHITRVNYLSTFHSFPCSWESFVIIGPASAQIT